MEIAMNRYIVTVIAAACAAAVPAFADDITIDPHPFVSTLTREQVRAETLEAMKQGSLNYGSGYDPLARYPAPKGPGRTRAEVTAEYLASRNDVTAMNAEDSGSSYMSRMAATRVRPATATELAKVE
jgi:Domain of unknown function (DUF4148)